MNRVDELGYLHRDPPRLLFPFSLLFRRKDFSPFGVTEDVLTGVFILESGLHVLCETYLTNDWDETFAAKNCPEDLFWVDVPAFWSTFLGAKFVILLAECGIGKCLVGDRDFLEPVLSMWVISVLIWMELDSKPTLMNRR